MLTGAQHAAFVLDGGFTGNGTGQALAYGRSNDTWSLITATSDGSLAPSGHGTRDRGDGLELAIIFKNGRLQTRSLWGNSSSAAFATMKMHPVLRTFRAEGSRLVMTSSNIFTARRAADPVPVTTTPTHSGSALPEGTWMASLEKINDSGTLIVQPVRYTKCPNSGDRFCSDDVGARVRFDVPDEMSTVLSGTSSFTAPGWVFKSAAFAATQGDGDLSLREFTPGAPYVVSPKLELSGAIGPLMRVTVKGGRVTQLGSVVFN